MIQTASSFLTWVAACAALMAQVSSAQETGITRLADVPAKVREGVHPRVRGVVTADIVRGYLFVQDETGSLCLRLEDSKPFAQGDMVEATVTGYEGREYWYIAATATFLGRGTLPEPESVTGDKISLQQHHARYISSRGTVVGHRRTTYSHIVDGRYVPLTYGVLETECEGLPVRVCFDLEHDLFKTIPIGSQIRFSGSARVHEIQGRTPNPYVAIWLEDPTMAVVERLPSFFQRVEVRRALRIAAMVIGGVIFILLLGWMLHRRHMRQLRTRNEELERRVAERTEELQHALERERKLGLVKNDFVSLVSHEFRTPLGVIMSAAEVLRRYFDRLEPAKRERHLEMICVSTANLSAMIEEVLLLGRMEEGKVSYSANPIDLRAFCGAVAEEVGAALKSRATIAVHFEGDLEGALGDESLLRHILGNLLSNACKYSRAGQVVNFRVMREGRDACFVVEDEGIGIPETDQERLFASFTRGSNVGALPGTGLGLVIVKRCVELHGGTLALESESGVGTVATVSLPLFPKTVESPRILPLSQSVES